jgi:hypothetical protein
MPDNVFTPEDPDLTTRVLLSNALVFKANLAPVVPEVFPKRTMLLLAEPPLLIWSVPALMKVSPE